MAYHFHQWRDASADMFAEPPEVSFCRSVYPAGPADWDAYRPGAVDDPAFQNGTLHVIHAPQYVQADKVDDFIAAVTLDGIGSTHEEPGCLRFDVYQNVEDPTELYLYEVYANRDAFDYHVGTPHIKLWRDTVADWYDEERRDASMAGNMGARRGRNVWPTRQLELVLRKTSVLNAYVPFAQRRGRGAKRTQGMPAATTNPLSPTWERARVRGNERQHPPLFAKQKGDAERSERRGGPYRQIVGATLVVAPKIQTSQNHKS